MSDPASHCGRCPCVSATSTDPLLPAPHLAAACKHCVDIEMDESVAFVTGRTSVSALIHGK